MKMMSSSDDIQELHTRQYLIYDTETEALEAIAELHDNQYLILDEYAVHELHEEFCDAFSKMAGYISLVPPSADNLPFNSTKKNVHKAIKEKFNSEFKGVELILSSVENQKKTYNSILMLYLEKNLDKGRACRASVTYNIRTKEVIIKEGSIFALYPTFSYMMTPQGTARMAFVDMNCEKKDNGYVLRKDTPCKSLLTATCFILGRNANALVEWKDEFGTTLKNLKLDF